MGATNTIRKAISVLKSQRGIVDIPSLVTGSVVVAIMAGGLAASVVLGIPWSQDFSAKQILTHVRTAETVASTSEKKFLPKDTLISKKFMKSTESFEVVVDYSSPDNVRGKCYLAFAPSKSGKIFYVTSKDGKPIELTPESLSLLVATPRACKIAGATTATENAASITAVVNRMGAELK